MAKHINFDVCRQAYGSSGLLSDLLDLGGDLDEAIAFFCAGKPKHETTSEASHMCHDGFHFPADNFP